MRRILAYFDFEKALIANYHKLKLDEIDLALILIINQLQIKDKIIDDKFLSKHMSVDKDVIDTHLSKLTELRYLLLKTKDEYAYLCLDNLINEVYDISFKQAAIESDLSLKSMFENEFARPLRPTEIELISLWKEHKIKDVTIIDAWKLSRMKNKLSLSYLDEILIKNGDYDPRVNVDQKGE